MPVGVVDGVAVCVGVLVGVTVGVGVGKMGSSAKSQEPGLQAPSPQSFVAVRSKPVTKGSKVSVAVGGVKPTYATSKQRPETPAPVVR